MTFYDKGYSSKPAIEWLEKTAKQLKIHIHHAMCGHGGERHVLGAPVDGFEPKTCTVFQFHGCWWHGCPRCFTDRGRQIRHGKTRDELYAATIARTRSLREAGYRVIEKWECQYARRQMSLVSQRIRNRTHTLFSTTSSHCTIRQREKCRQQI